MLHFLVTRSFLCVAALQISNITHTHIQDVIGCDFFGVTCKLLVMQSLETEKCSDLSLGYF